MTLVQLVTACGCSRMMEVADATAAAAEIVVPFMPPVARTADDIRYFEDPQERLEREAKQIRQRRFRRVRPGLYHEVIT